MAVYFPGVPLVPTMSTGATDGIFLEAVGIPLRAAGWIWRSRRQWGAWFERAAQRRSVYIGRDFLQDLVKDYANR
jgi:hypothetical protein